MNELDCAAVSLRLSDWLAGELAEPEARALALHLERCARCARERAELEGLERLFARDATPASSDVAEARLKLRRALARERGAAAGATMRPIGLRRGRILWRTIGEAAGFALLLALFVPIFPRLRHGVAPTAANGVTDELASQARELVASAGSWLPALSEWRLPAAPPESLRAWFGALHSDAR